MKAGVVSAPSAGVARASQLSAARAREKEEERERTRVVDAQRAVLGARDEEQKVQHRVERVSRCYEESASQQCGLARDSREGEGEDAPRFHSALLTNARRSCSSTCAPSRPSSRYSGTASGAKYCTCVSTVKLWSGERDERSGRMWPAREGARERQLRRAFLDVEWREGNARERSSWASHERTALPAAESWLRRLKTSLMCGEYLTTRESASSVRVG